MDRERKKERKEKNEDGYKINKWFTFTSRKMMYKHGLFRDQRHFLWLWDTIDTKSYKKYCVYTVVTKIDCDSLWPK